MLPRPLPRPLPCPRLHDKIMEVGGSRVQVQQAKVDQLSSEIDGCTAGITKAGVTSKTSERCVVGMCCIVLAHSSQEFQFGHFGSFKGSFFSEWVL